MECRTVDKLFENSQLGIGTSVVDMDTFDFLVIHLGAYHEGNLFVEKPRWQLLLPEAELCRKLETYTVRQFDAARQKHFHLLPATIACEAVLRRSGIVRGLHLVKRAG